MILIGLALLSFGVGQLIDHPLRSEQIESDFPPIADMEGSDPGMSQMGPRAVIFRPRVVNASWAQSQHFYSG